jgi:hypothetical protein
MAYTMFDQVQELLPNDLIIDSTTNPSLETVEGWLPQLDATLNVHFATGGGTVPVVDANVLAWFALLEAKEAAYMVMQVVGASEESKSLFQNYHEDWLAALERLSGTDDAVITPPGTSTGSPSSYRDQEPQLTREKVY